jgi:3-dehydroquinate synthase
LQLTVHVPGIAGRTYDVVIGAGAAAALPRYLESAAPAARYAVIAPDDVAEHAQQLLDVLRSAGRSADLLWFPAGEAHKTRDTWAALTDRMLDLRFGRDCAVIAVGGGVAGDVAGFVAATYMRGVPVVQVPTTLLAMIDASVGGKTGVDTAAGKNLVGAFHPPRLVLADPLFLRTLPDAALRDGLAEAVKHGAILDEGYLDWITTDAGAILAQDPQALEELVAQSVRLKAAVVREDPFEAGRRAVLNFGHTLGHALETCSGYTVSHGQAVAMGMVLEASAGEALGVTEPGTAERLRAAVRACGLPVAAPAVDADALLAALRVDKKALEGRVRCVLLSRLGACAQDEAGRWTFDVPEAVLLDAVRADHRI